MFPCLLLPALLPLSLPERAGVTEEAEVKQYKLYKEETTELGDVGLSKAELELDLRWQSSTRRKWTAIDDSFPVAWSSSKCIYAPAPRLDLFSCASLPSLAFLCCVDLEDM
ncbi:Os03g0103350 [Oryza sativa Japonica Group]|uniref:Os03g0103350 protein n=1 Tax=Oryza sativa subsp. japonica TaxID=39947 RepID=A0A0P0VRY7_ORYSJ|nr:Os03g0103350 [Oryza sativa Japonica Group]